MSGPYRCSWRHWLAAAAAVACVPVLAADDPPKARDSRDFTSIERRSWTYSSRVSMNSMDWQFEGEEQFLQREDGRVRGHARDEPASKIDTGDTLRGFLEARPMDEGPQLPLEAPRPVAEPDKSKNWLLPPPPDGEASSEDLEANPLAESLLAQEGSTNSLQEALRLYESTNELTEIARENRYMNADGHLLITDEDITDDLIQETLQRQDAKGDDADAAYEPVVSTRALDDSEEMEPVIADTVVEDEDASEDNEESENERLVSIEALHELNLSEEEIAAYNEYQTDVQAGVGRTSAGFSRIRQALNSLSGFAAAGSIDTMGIDDSVSAAAADTAGWRGTFRYLSEAIPPSDAPVDGFDEAASAAEGTSRPTGYSPMPDTPQADHDTRFEGYEMPTFEPVEYSATPSYDMDVTSKRGAPLDDFAGETGRRQDVSFGDTRFGSSRSSDRRGIGFGSDNSYADDNREANRRGRGGRVGGTSFDDDFSSGISTLEEGFGGF